MTESNASADIAGLVADIAKLTANISPEVSVVTYNVLSSALSDPNSFNGYSESDIDPSNRFTLLIEKLKCYIENNTIICLQEVSQDWSGSLHTYFHSAGYTMIYSQYGNEFNNYMGVAIAFPNIYAVKDIIICKPANTIKWPHNKKITFYEKTISWFVKKSDSTEAMAKKKWNSIIMVCLEIGEYCFWVATYHMPCAFRTPDVMIYHAMLSLKLIQDTAANTPYIFCGDFNFAPESEPYKYICKNAKELTIQDSNSAANMVADDADLSTWYSHEFTVLTVQKVNSAYCTYHGAEPAYTNHVDGWSGPFTSTLDYIFYNGMNLKYVKKIEPDNKLLPHATEPSDHLPVYAEFSLICN